MKVSNQSAYSDWLCQYEWHIAVSLNMRANINKSTAQLAARHFWHKLDCDTFGCTQVKKHKTRIVRACFIEGETAVRNFHYHAAVQLPFLAGSTLLLNDARVVRFAEMIKLRWEELQEAGKYSVCTHIHNSAGWVKYICKDAGRGDSEFCALTSHLPD